MSKREKPLTRNSAAKFLETYLHKQQTIFLGREKSGGGKAVVKQSASDLQSEFPGVGGFSASSFWRMNGFFEAGTGLSRVARAKRPGRSIAKRRLISEQNP